MELIKKASKIINKRPINNYIIVKIISAIIIDNRPLDINKKPIKGS